ncbi:MAG: hypothetical protein K8T91_27235 [Planctomycetes bacterium]|nr:hypothetical protein [Planctomycetota bacterium]
MLSSLPAALHAGAPNAQDLDTAIKSGDFATYISNANSWLNEQAPAGAADKLSKSALETLLKDPVFAKTLVQRQLIFKTGAHKLGDFAKADPANQIFLRWLLNNTQAMDLYLEGVVPIGLAAREQNGYLLTTAPLGIWKTIVNADPDAKDGLYLKLAIATAIAPPGSGAPGAGQAKSPVAPLDRYLHFKAAHKNKELFPSFDTLTVWELTKVVQSGASNEDLAWARQMINTWRPDLRENELVVNSTSEVWRRNSPISFDNCYKNVLAGGGKCGPRSSWSVFICQAFGVPAIGVGQPAHACVAYKCVNPMAQPQPGSAWKVGYGRGWQVSKLEGMGGLDFLAGVEERAHAAEFSTVEHLRWFAAALEAAEPKGAVMNVAHDIQKSLKKVKTDVTASLKAEEAEKELIAKTKAIKASAAAPAGPIKLATDVTRIEADAFSSKLATRVLDCFTGGKQVNFDKSVQDSWVEYTLDVPATGNYTLEIKVAAANVEQVLNVTAGTSKPVTIKVPHTTGLWGVTPATEIKLEKGVQTLKIAAPFQRGVAVRSLELKPKS